MAPSPTLPSTNRPRPAMATPTPANLTADQIAATAVADAAGEECVSAPPKPAKGFIGDPARGKVLFSQRGCSACHGDRAQGDVGPRLAGTTLTFQQVIHQLREPRGVMQRYLPKDQSDADECDVYIYVKGLKPGA
ncbi:MAG TPA: cytochrome c [Chloroflexota bacterium]|nr:cytochrome c [Chloroflexota bacterium]